ncbi:MAG TPA: acyl-ACP--UDP-N-acetylglucosamine O-acyltransferase [Pyrinomonadaceae bacterium]|nr:acyl-ACP--UDP-N-acetylglucosamine O-acyltransferase [Pyrinomonadaceae bacterium]
MEIHPTAVVHPRAQLGRGVRVGPYAVVEEDVTIGDDCELGAHSVVKRFTTLGRRNRVFEHATLGGEPQDWKYKGERSALVLGDDNVIREYATLHRARGEDEATRVGSRNFLMVSVHVAHNCEVGDDNVFANGVALAGHVAVADHVFLASNVGAHQFTRFGRFAMVGGKSKIVQDVLPFFTTDGNPARVRGINVVGLRRGGFTPEARLAIRRAFGLLFRERLPLAEALERALALGDENVAHLVDFMRGSRRGFTGVERRAVEAASGAAGEDDSESDS